MYTEGTHEASGAKARTPLRVLGAVALLASFGTVAIDRFLGRRRDTAAAELIGAEFDRIDLARRDLDHRIRQVENRVLAETETTHASGRVTCDLDAVRHTISGMLLRAEAAEQAYAAASVACAD